MQAFRIFLLVVIATISCATHAGADARNLGVCMIDSLDGKERKLLAKWVFFAMAEHPEIKVFANVTGDDRDVSDIAVGKLMTRLLASDCAVELSQAYQADPAAVEKAFELVGQVAMRELMADDDVSRAIVNYANYADLEKINAILEGE